MGAVGLWWQSGVSANVLGVGVGGWVWLLGAGVGCGCAGVGVGCGCWVWVLLGGLAELGMLVGCPRDRLGQQ